jgi:BirA family biotin operon repressor/biotin-[acetyl-CoA-carboxylase] ligase
MSFLEFTRTLRQGYRGGGRSQVVFADVPSTHLVARRLVEELVAEYSPVPPVDFFAYGQSAGRGRQDRAWASPPGGGVYASLVRVLAVPAQQLPLLVAVALAEGLAPWLGEKCRLKWPNDLLVDGRKLGGILIDVKSRPDEEPVALISFGVNAAGAPQIPGKLRATALAEWGEAPPAAELALALVLAVDRLLAAPPADLVARYRALSAHTPGQELRCRLPEGELHGRFLGIDDAGFLRLEVDGGERLLVAGELEPNA